MPRRFMPSRLRLAELLALEEKLARPGSDVALDDQLYQEPQSRSRCCTHGKFAVPSGLATRCRLYPPGGAYGAWR